MSTWSASWWLGSSVAALACVARMGSVLAADAACLGTFVSAIQHSQVGCRITSEALRAILHGSIHPLVVGSRSTESGR